MIKEWKQGFHSCKIETEKRLFTCSLKDEPIDENKTFLDIVYDILKNAPKPVEILYSGGKDSELVLYACMRLKIPFVALTMEIAHDGKLVNTHDLYYASKFCFANDINQKLIQLDSKKIFEQGLYFDNLKKYFIKLPHVASHFFAIEHCHNFPVIAGYWPWVQVGEQSVLSPIRLDFCSYEEFMQEKNIPGIGNFLSNNLEITNFLCKSHLRNYKINDSEADLKYKMYSEIMPFIEKRYKSMGWELKIPELKLTEYAQKLNYSQTRLRSVVSWGSMLQKTLQTTKNYNEQF